MYKVLAIVLLLFSQTMSTEVTMALRNSAGQRPAAQTTARPAPRGGGNTGNGSGSGGGTVWGNAGAGATVNNQTSPYNYATSPMFQNNQATPNVQTGSPSTPAWLKKLRETEPGAQPYNYGSSPMFQNNPATPNATATQSIPRVPAWLQAIRNNAQGGGAFNYGNRNSVQNNPATPNAPAPTQSGYGGTNPNPDVTQGTLRGTNQPFVIGQDSITQSPTSPYDSYAGVRFPQLQLMLSGRSNGQEVGAGTLDPALWDQAAGGGSGFGSSYGGNWRRGGGGGGGGGGWGSGYSNADNYPAWMKLAMGLNSWNIK